MEQKEIILEYLENAYTGAKMSEDFEMMCRLSRALIAFSYDGIEECPDWAEMQKEFVNKE